MTIPLPIPVRSYLEQLELALKARPVTSVEDALSDAREHLVRDWEALSRTDPTLSNEEFRSHFNESFGTPEQAAESFRIPGTDDRVRGNAPDWRICCRSCGRSYPADYFPVIRIGAYSLYKLTLTWCYGCNQLRWVRIIGDRKKTNLTETMGMTCPANEARTQIHRFPFLKFGFATLLACIALSLGIIFLTLGITVGVFLLVEGKVFATQPSKLPFEVPKPWKVVKNDTISAAQAKGIGSKLKANLVGLNNTILDRNGSQIQVNTLRCATSKDADQAYAELLKIKKNPRFLVRRENTIFELVAKDAKQMRTALLARYELGIHSTQVQYQVAFDAAPLKRADGMEWNKMFNLCLQAEKGDAGALAQINGAKKHFEFAEQLSLRSVGIGTIPSKWQVSSKADGKLNTDSGTIQFELNPESKKFDIPFLHVEGTVTCRNLAKTPFSGDSKRWLAATKAWPSKSTTFQKLAKGLVAGKTNDEAKLQAILDWFVESGKIQFGGAVTGSRYGAEKVLEQGLGHCWDFSDVMITLCRASQLPSRQVLGWLHGSEGHVWVEVLIDQQWRQVDPTTGIGCGSDYVPFAVSDDGEPPLIYLSPVKLNAVD